VRAEKRAEKGMLSKMSRTVIEIPEDLKAELERVAAETGRSEAEIICEGIRLAIARLLPPAPTIPIFVSEDPHFAEKVDDYLAGFGEQ